MASKKRKAGLWAALVGLCGLVYAWFALGGIHLGELPWEQDPPGGTTHGDESESPPEDSGGLGSTGSPTVSEATTTSSQGVSTETATQSPEETEATAEAGATTGSQGSSDGPNVTTDGQETGT